MRFIAFLPLALLIGCQTTRQPYAPVANVSYAAIGGEGGWLLNIGDDRIVLSRPHADSEELIYDESVWPRVLPRTVDGVRTWEAANGTYRIVIEARPGPCTIGRNTVYEDNIIIRVDGGERIGCGGRLIRGGRR